MTMRLPSRLAAFLLIPFGILVSGAALAASFSVNIAGSSDDKDLTDGQCLDAANKCSLNAAIQQANAINGSHTITFAVGTVTLTKNLEQVKAPITIGNPVLKTVLNGAGSFSCFDLTDSGLTGTDHVYNTMTGVGGADGTTIKNMVIQNCHGHGISANGHGYIFDSNYIGTNSLGLAAVPNSQSGISISASRVYSQETNQFLMDLFNQIPFNLLDNGQISSFASQFNTLLANLKPVVISNNVISGNTDHGLDIFSENLAGVWIKGNNIGTDLTGNLAIPNQKDGIHYAGGAFGQMIGPDNIVSGNLMNGLNMGSGAVSLPNFIAGNRIGVGNLSTSNIGNGQSGIVTDTKPESSVNGHINPSMISLIIGPANIISDNKGANNDLFPDDVNGTNAGILITGASSGIKVRGNTIGLGEFPSGTPLSSLNYGNKGDGIIVTVSDIEIGGSGPGQGNVIAGNARHGIVIKSSDVNGTKVLGNSIGVHPALANDLTLGNGVDGIHINSASTSFIGGAGATDFNTIAANGRNGIKIRLGGFANGWGHLMQRNRIFGNGLIGTGIGIDLDHVENGPNDPSLDEIPGNYTNLDQNTPVICTGNAGDPAACGMSSGPTDAGGSTTIKWTMKTHGPGEIPTTYRAEFFKIDAASDNAATSMTFLGEQIVTADVLGVLSCPNALCTAPINAPTAGSRVVMTVTDATAITNTLGMTGWTSSVKCLVFMNCFVNDTSEFSNVVQSVQVPVNTMTDVTNVSPNPSVYGQSVTVTASVTAVSGAIAPTGSVTINAGASSCIAALGSPMSLTSTGSCQLSPAPVVPGAPVTATYAGNAQFNGSNGGMVTLTVTQANTTTTIASDTPDPSLQGAAVVVTASVAAVAPGAGTPTGTMTVTDSVDNCTITLPATSCNLSLTTLGARNIVATYNGDTNFNASPASVSAQHQVDSAGAAATTTAVTNVNPATSVFGQTVAVTVTVTSSGQADGTATVTAGGSSCNGPLVGATPTTSTLSCNLAPPLGVAGSPYTVSATYSGSAGFAPSASSGAGNASATVNKADTTTSISTHTPNPSNANAAITVTAGVVATAPGAGTPGGTIVVTSTPGGETCTITLPAPSCNVTPVTAGGKTLIAVYSGDANFNVSTSAGVSHTVDPGGATATTTAVTQVNPGTAVYGQAVAVTVSVTAGSGSAAPAGNVAVTAGSSMCLAVLGASATTTATGSCNLAPPPAASGSAYTVVAAYAGNATFAASSSSGGANGMLTVNKANTTTAITTHIPTPSIVNAPVAVTATLAVTAPGSGTPSGTITIKSDNPITDQCTITLPATSCNITLTTTGTKTLTATYNGDGNFNTSTSAGVSHQVNAGGSTQTTSAITIVAPQGSGNLTPSATAVFGQPVAVTATVTANSGAVAPDGTITITAGGSSCNVALGSPVGTTAKGTCTLAPALAANGAAYSVSVGYSGTATFAASNASNGTLTVNKATTTTTISGDSPDPSNANSPIAVTVGVVVNALGAGTPTGTITVTSNPGGDSCTITLPATSCNLTPLTAGGKTLTAVYNGDSNFMTSTSAGASHTVNGGGLTTTTTIVSSVSPGTIVYGQAFTVTAAVTAGSGAVAPNGTVTITAGTSVCSAPLGSPVNLTSTANCTPTPALPAGSTYLVSASYGGTPTFSPSASSGGGNGSLTVNKASTTSTISPAPSPSVGLTAITVTVGVNVNAPGSGMPTGSVLVSDGTSNCTVTLPATSCNLTPTTTGPKTLTATYSGDANFLTSNTAVSHTVNPLVVFSSPTATPGVSAVVTLTGSATCTLVSPAFVPPSVVPESPPLGITLPFGLFEFQTSGCGVGGTITIQIVYSQAIPGNAQYWKYGPTPGGGSNSIPHWYQLPSASIAGNTVTFTITDGQIGDDDLTANGVIVDQGGPAVLPATNIPTLSDVGRLALLLAMLLLGGLAMRRRRGRD